MGNYLTDKSGHVLDAEEVYRQHLETESLTPEHEEVKALVEKYLKKGQISEVEYLRLKSHIIQDIMMRGDCRLYPVIQDIEHKQEQQDYQAFHTILGTQQLTKSQQWFKAVSKIDAASVTVALAILFVGVGYVYPKLMQALKTSNRAMFVFMLAGLGSMMVILKIKPILTFFGL